MTNTYIYLTLISYLTPPPPLGTFKLSLLYEERALAARTDGDVERAIALYTKAEKYAWEGTRVFGLINDRDMEAIVRGRAVGIDRYTHIIHQACILIMSCYLPI